MDFPATFAKVTEVYPLVMTNSLPWKDPPFLSSVNHLFLYMGHLYHSKLLVYQRFTLSLWCKQSRCSYRGLTLRLLISINVTRTPSASPFATAVGLLEAESEAGGATLLSASFDCLMGGHASRVLTWRTWHEDREKRKNDWSRETEVLVVLVDRKSIPLENTDTEWYWFIIYI